MDLPKGFRSGGFTLVELLVVIAIIAVIAAVVVLLINPLEIMRKGRDSTRLSDLKAIMKSVEIGLQDAGGTTATFLCYTPATAPCTAHSNDGGNMRINNGTGWVKVNFGALPTVTVTTLPLDPTNNSTHHYTYASDGDKYEFNAVLESSQNAALMQNDGGDNPNAYEIGSSLTVIN
jgi:prepilin-type N-terminal cleavage/methylation domain-containing protein